MPWVRIIRVIWDPSPPSGVGVRIIGIIGGTFLLPVVLSASVGPVSPPSGSFLSRDPFACPEGVLSASSGWGSLSPAL